MIGLDTNILLRAVTDDDRKRSPLARRLLAQLSPDNRGVLNCVVLAEFVWTLRTGYDYERLEIVEMIEGMLRSGAYFFTDRDAVVAAVAKCGKEPLHFADALIGELNRGAGCNRTMTFDVGAGKSDAFQLVEL